MTVSDDSGSNGKLRYEMADLRVQLDAARDDAARFARALEQAHVRYLELAESYDHASEARARHAEQELAALLATKSYRLLKIPRRIWSVVRQRQ